MPQTVRKFFVLPTPEELASTSGPITLTLTPYLTQAAADQAAVIEAIKTGKERIVVQSIAWANPTLVPASITTQINAIP